MNGHPNRGSVMYLASARPSRGGRGGRGSPWVARGWPVGGPWGPWVARGGPREGFKQRIMLEVSKKHPKMKNEKKTN